MSSNNDLLMILARQIELLNELSVVVAGLQATLKPKELAKLRELVRQMKTNLGASIPE